jgi:hypothetical protein
MPPQDREEASAPRPCLKHGRARVPPRGRASKPRITKEERSRIIALGGKDPPGKLITEPGGGLQTEVEEGAAYSRLWTRLLRPHKGWASR